MATATTPSAVVSELVGQAKPWLPLICLLPGAPPLPLQPPSQRLHNSHCVHADRCLPATDGRGVPSPIIVVVITVRIRLTDGPR